MADHETSEHQGMHEGTDGAQDIEIHVVSDLGSIEAAAWDACAGHDNPFVEHAFLHLLETSGSVGDGTGWLPVHLVVRAGEQVLGAAPTYLKQHSYGEYIFDWAFVDASERAGIPYYPKIVVGVPFTPATGPRLLVHPDADRNLVIRALAQGLRALEQELGASSVHVLFSTDAEAAALEKHGFLRRATHQYHFRNPGYASFDAYLATLRSSHRKQVKKERRRGQTDVRIVLDYAENHGPNVWATLDALYRSTAARKWGDPYLTPAFFAQAERLERRALVGLAYRGDDVVAGTLAFEKGKHVYGRYWGAFTACDSLHFELCYHALIEYAIDRGLRLVEAGAQGEHKLKRGFEPVVTHSAHHFRHPGLHEAAARFYAEEAAHVHDAVIPQLTCRTPYRADARPDLPARAGITWDCEKP